MTALELARKILSLDENNYPGLLILGHATIEELTEMEGIGTVKAIQLKAIGELAGRFVKAKRPGMITLSSSDQIAEHYMEDFRHLGYEQILLGMTNNKGGLIGDEIISRGTVNQSLLSVRDLFLRAIKKGAVRIFLVHNHPSGDPTPSSEDIALTKRVVDAGKLLEIPLIDHIILGDLEYNSLIQQGQVVSSSWEYH